MGPRDGPGAVPAARVPHPLPAAPGGAGRDRRLAGGRGDEPRRGGRAAHHREGARRPARPRGPGRGALRARSRLARGPGAWRAAGDRDRGRGNGRVRAGRPARGRRRALLARRARRARRRAARDPPGQGADARAGRRGRCDRGDARPRHRADGLPRRSRGREVRPRGARRPVLWHRAGLARSGRGRRHAGPRRRGGGGGRRPEGRGHRAPRRRAADRAGAAGAVVPLHRRRTPARPGPRGDGAGRRPHRPRVPRPDARGAPEAVQRARDQDPRARGRALRRELGPATAPDPLRGARADAGQEDQDGTVDRRRLAPEDGRGERAPDPRRPAPVPGGREAPQHLRRRAPTVDPCRRAHPRDVQPAGDDHGPDLEREPEPPEHPGAHRGGPGDAASLRGRGRCGAAHGRLLPDRAADPCPPRRGPGAHRRVRRAVPTSTRSPRHACSVWRSPRSTTSSAGSPRS